jgi:uncharacterized protein (DUF1499 family)
MASTIWASPWFAAFPRWAFILAVLCVLAALGSGLGYRAGWWSFRTGFGLLSTAFFCGMLAAVLAVVGIIAATKTQASGRVLLSLAALAIAIVIVYWPYHYKRLVASLPFIHDISTDTTDPPAFVAVRALRLATDHPVAYDGAEVAAQQHTAYPDLAPLEINRSPADAFAAARAVLAEMKLDEVAAVVEEGRLEATATTFFYGFKDDLVVRIRPTATGSRIDVRSKSRVGRSDVGANAKRIRAFMMLMQRRLVG